MSDSFQERRAKLLSTRTPPPRNPSVHENNSLKDPNIWLYKYDYMRGEDVIPFDNTLSWVPSCCHSFIHSFIHPQLSHSGFPMDEAIVGAGLT
jgi:hypothetical protein